MNSIQMIGDSLTRRLQFYSERNRTQLGIDFKIALSGAKISDLKRIIKSPTCNLGSCDCLIIWIGTNDIFSKNQIKQINSQFTSLLRLIKRKISVTKIIVLDLPIFPKVTHNSQNFEKLNEFNTFLHTLSNHTTKVLSTQSILNSAILFNSKYFNSNRIDGVHLNNKGNFILTQFLKATIK